MFSNKKILLGVCGGIAAYKAVDIVSRLRKAGAEIKVVMTEAASKFVTPMTFREISGNQVVLSMWTDIPIHNVEHIALANWADAVLIAPATANMIAKMAAGIADDMLSTTILSTKAPVIICPAMNTNMFENTVTQQNLQKLQNLGVQIIEPAVGQLACGTFGKGRLPDPEQIVKNLAYFLNNKTLAGLKILVTAGGTAEVIDPVRYIGNRSSGKMGYAIAEEAIKRGAQVVLVAGMSNLPAPSGVILKKVESAMEMRQAVLEEYGDVDIVIKAAAVADYRVKNSFDRKIKKNEDTLTLELVKNPDILKELGENKKKQYLVGFAAETNDLITYAQSKIKEKNLDMIVANDVSLPEAGFNHDTNIVKFIFPDGRIIDVEKATKRQIAEVLFDNIQQNFRK